MGFGERKNEGETETEKRRRRPPGYFFQGMRVFMATNRIWVSEIGGNLVVGEK